MSVFCTLHVCSTQRQQELLETLEQGYKMLCISMWVLGMEPCPLEQQQVLLNIELLFYTGICEYRDPKLFIAAYKITLFISILFHITLHW